MRSNPRGTKSTGFSPLDSGAIENAIRVCRLIKRSRKRVPKKIKETAWQAEEWLEDLAVMLERYGDK